MKAVLALYRSAKEKPFDKWDHSGYQLLYPDVPNDIHENSGSKLLSKPPKSIHKKSIGINSAEILTHASSDFLDRTNACDGTSSISSRSSNETIRKASRLSINHEEEIKNKK